MPTKKERPEEKPQRERFVEAAREAGADETQDGFERAFEKITLSKTPKSPEEDSR